MLHGNGVSGGYAVGPLYRYVPFAPVVEEGHFPREEAGERLLAYRRAKEAAMVELSAMAEALAESDPDKAKIFSAHQDVLDDPVMDEEIEENIESQCMAPDWAICSVYDTYTQALARAKDALIRERAVDLQDVKNRLLRVLYGEPERNLARLPGPCVIAARDLFPSDTATLDRENVLGIVTEVGSATSHSAIIARSYGIPAVLGVDGLMDSLADGTVVALDAVAGTLLPDPDEQTALAYGEKRAAYLEQMALSAKFVDKAAVTADGTEIEIGLNIGSAQLPDIHSHCGYVGLFRTEFLYMESDHMPTEAEQAVAYGKVLSGMGGRPVTLRTLDIGGDKKLSYLPLPEEENPFMGNRALRLCFDRPDLFRTQLRAALGAGAKGTLWIMFPMVGSLEDWRRAKAFTEEVRAELTGEGVPVPDTVKLGIMVEIPAVARFADKFAAEVDFASIGTNDLCQYLFAADRMNSKVTGYYQQFSPILFRTLSAIADAFGRAGKPLSICGELGGDPLATPVLIGLGLRKLSMNASSVGAVKRVIRSVTVDRCRELAARVMDMDTEAQVLDACRALAEEINQSIQSEE